MAIHDMWSFDHAPQGATDLSPGSTFASYTQTGLYNQYSGNPGMLVKNSATSVAITTDGFLTFTSSTTNPCLLVQPNQVQNWSTSSQYWIGFRTKTSLQNGVAAPIFAMADSLTITNYLAILSESDMTTAGANVLNTEYYVEIFIDRTNLAYQVWLNGVQIKTGAIPSAVAVANGNGYYLWGPYNNLGTTVASAVRAFRDFYFLDIDSVDKGRLGSISSSLQTVAQVSSPNYTTYLAALVGAASLSSTQAMFGSSSFVAGAGVSYASIPASPQTTLSSDFTVEFWMYPTSTAAQQMLISKGANSSILFSSTTLYVYDDGGTNRITASSAIVLNTWQHIALVRQGTTYTLYVNGVSKGTTTVSTSFWVSANPIYIGNSFAGNYPYSGYMDELRISNLARYTAPFTPPAAAFTPDSRTVLLMHFETTANGLLTDDSGNTLNVFQTAYPTPPTATPYANNAPSDDSLATTFSTSLTQAPILAMDYRFAAQISSSGIGAVQTGNLIQGSNNVTLPSYAYQDVLMNYGRRAGLARYAPDGGAWNPTKLAATQLVMTPAF